MQRAVVLIALLGTLIFVFVKWRAASDTVAERKSADTVIEKRDIQFTQRSFDPENPPAEMPPLTTGEDAECDSSFTSDTNVAGETRKDDDSHGTVTITQVKMALGLNITIWVPIGVSQQILQHEEGHREISEHYYQSADKLAKRIAAKHVGKKFEISGSDLNAEADIVLKKLAKQINDEFSSTLDPGPTQNYYDGLTNHSRNAISAREAVDEALKSIAID